MMETKKMISLTLAELLAVSWAWGAVAADCEAADYLPPAGVILKGGQIDSSTVEVGAFDDSLLNEGGKMRLLRRICGLSRGGLDDGDRGSRRPARRGDRCGIPNA